MKRILLPFFLFASAVSAHPEPILIRHPQAEVNYYCPYGQPLQHCIDIACCYATQYGCRVIAQNQNTYFIETYIPPSYVPPVVILPSPVVYMPSPIFWFNFNRQQPQNNHHDYRHRPRRR